MNKDYWMYIEPYTHIEIKTNKILLFNTLNNKSIEVKNIPIINSLIRKLLLPENCFVILLKQNEIINPVIRTFLRNLRSTFCGDYFETIQSNGKPVQIMPQINLMKEISFKKKKEVPEGKQILNYLKELTFYLTSDTELRNDKLKYAFKQFHYPIQNYSGIEFSYSILTDTLNSIKELNLPNVNFIGGNIFNYKQIFELIKELLRYPSNKTLFFHINDFICDKVDNAVKLFEIINDIKSFHLKIYIDIPNDESKINSFVEKIKPYTLNIKYLCIVENEKDIETFEHLFENFDLKYEYIPVFNGKNRTFFKDQVYINKMDILKSKNSIEDILLKQIINPLTFGRLVVLNDLKAYSDLNCKSIGVLKENSLNEIVYKELCYGKYWLRLRKGIKPCNNCIYNSLCPPISNYELVMKKNNLCKIVLD